MPKNKDSLADPIATRLPQYADDIITRISKLTRLSKSDICRITILNNLDDLEQRFQALVDGTHPEADDDMIVENGDELND